MAVRLAIQHAPNPAASRLPDPRCPPDADTGGVGQPEACLHCPPSETLLIACVLAGWGNTLALPYMTLDQAEHLVFSVLSQRSHDSVRNWQPHVDRGERRTRWNAAVAATRRLYGEWFDMSALMLVEPAPPAPAEPAEALVVARS